MEFKFGSVGFLVKKGKAAHEPKAQTAGGYPGSVAWSMPISVATPSERDTSPSLGYPQQ